MKGTLYLLPCPVSDETAPSEVLPAANFEVMRGLDYFIVENPRTARRFLSRAGVASQTGTVGAAGLEAARVSGAVGSEVAGAASTAGGGARAFDSLEFAELNEHTRPEEIEAMLAPLEAGRSAGVISEAGVPAVADPGADIVAAAHRRGIRVVPLVGPSSILMALMASGMNGQSFAFNGYLPAKTPERTKAMKFFERRAVSEGQSQIFIETPYRNGKLLAELLNVCAPGTRLCVASDITSPNEFIRTATIAEWRRIAMIDGAGKTAKAIATKKTEPGADRAKHDAGKTASESLPPLDKRPAIFILG